MSISKTNTSKQSLFKLLFLVIILLILISLYALKSIPQNLGNNVLSPFIEPLKKTLRIKSPEIHPDSTGGVIIHSTPGPQFRQKFILRKELPIDNDSYTLVYDYNNLQYIVALKKPYQESRNKFIEWITNNYPGISPEEFVFVNQS